MIHVFPKRSGMTRYAWCYEVRRDDVTKWLGRGNTNKLKQVTCPNCRSRLAAALAEARRLISEGR